MPKAFLNPVSFFGLILATVSLGASAFLLFLHLLGFTQRPYTGILTFFVFPAFLILGMLIVPLGAWWNRRRMRRRGQGLPAFPVVDLNQPRERRFYAGFCVLTLFILFLSILGGYEAYEFTESVTFCGQVCHSVMEPEFVAYGNSPHARVKCVECHVGSGAEWYLRAKASGVEQVRSILTGGYPRPIPTPLTNLRPALETCEECHWSEKSFGTQVFARTAFAYDAHNSPREFQMLMKTGAGGGSRGAGAGIHWHAGRGHRVEYAARDPDRLDVAWVRSVDAAGKVTEYTDPDRPPTPEERRRLGSRRMDCMDCHNRPAHAFRSPERAVDAALADGRLDPRAPHLKEAAVAALAAEYASRPEAEAGIEARLRAFYGEKGLAPEAIAGGGFPAIVEEVRRIHRQNFFPEMKANWAAYPDHIGHREFPGCFRCHNDRHRSAEGKLLSRDCELCHTFARRPEDGKGLTALPADGSFLHPFEHEKHFRMDCTSCHSGKGSPYGGCARCHDPEPGAPMAFACSGCHRPLKVKVENGECAACHEASKSKLHSSKSHGDCLACHKQHEWKTVSYPEDCTGSCHQDLKEPHHPGEPCSPCHDFKGVTSFMAAPAAWPGSAPGGTGSGH